MNKLLETLYHSLYTPLFASGVTNRQMSGVCSQK